MDIDESKIDEVVLALLHLTSFGIEGATRAWKSHDWAVLDRLYEKGFIGDPKGKAKSVIFTEAGEQQSRELFSKYFTKAG